MGGELVALVEPVVQPSVRRAHWWRFAAAVVALAIGQRAMSLAGGVVAGQVPLGSVDPGNWWVRLSVHHVVQALLGLGVMGLLARRYGLDFGLGLGDRRWGVRATSVVCGALVIYLVGVHLAFRALGHPLSSTVPVDPSARTGYLAFQLLLTGPSEELIFRALTITVLAGFASVVLVRPWGVRLEAVVAAVLFSLAHVSLTLGSWQATADPLQLAFALVLGTIQGVVFQRSRSVVYPMVIHSFSNLVVTLVRFAGL